MLREQPSHKMLHFTTCTRLAAEARVRWETQGELELNLAEVAGLVISGLISTGCSELMFLEANTKRCHEDNTKKKSSHRHCGLNTLPGIMSIRFLGRRQTYTVLPACGSLMCRTGHTL